MLANKWAQSGEEPLLKDVMSDPIVGLIMARDNLEEDDVWKVLEKAKLHVAQKAA